MQKFSRSRLPSAERFVLWMVLLCAVGFVLAGVLVGWQDAAEKLGLVQGQTFLALVGLALLNSLLRGLRWPLWAFVLGLDVPMRRMALYYTAGFAFVPTPGKVGTAIRLWFLKKNHDVPYVTGTGLMIMDQLTDLLALVVLSCVGLSVWVGSGALVAMGIGFLVLPFFVPQMAAWMGWLAVFLPSFLRGVVESVLQVWDVVQQLVRPEVMGGSVLLSLAAWLGQGIGLWLVLTDFGVEIDVFFAVYVFAFAAVVGALSMLPGGLGSTEVVMVGLLYGAGVPTETAVLATALVRLFSLWLPVGLGFVCLPYALRLVRH